jgi:histidinol-phosphate aminotransferase
MNRVREPFNTNAVAQAAAEAALEDTAHVERSVKLNNEGKSFFYREFTGLGMDYVPTEANFIFISVNDAAVLYEELLRLGVIIRPMGARAVRVTIGLPEENKRLIDALKKLKGKGIF